MKKIALALTTAALLASASMASEFTTLKIGYEHASIGDNITGNGGVVGLDWMMPTTYLGNGTTTGIEIGFGLDFDIYQAKDDTTNDTDLYGGGDAKLLVGYRYENFSIDGGVGYGYTKVADSSYLLGMTYHAQAKYFFTDKYGMEVSYKGGDMSLETSAGSAPDVSTSYVGVSFIWKN